MPIRDQREKNRLVGIKGLQLEGDCTRGHEHSMGQSRTMDTNDLNDTKKSIQQLSKAPTKWKEAVTCTRVFVETTYEA